MHKLFIFVLIIFVTNSLFPDEISFPDYDYSKMRNMFFPCDEGSDNEKKLINYLEAYCKSNSITDYKIDKIEDEKIITNSVNFTISIHPEKRTDQNIIFFCPLNSQIIYQDFHDNSLSINIMLNLLHKVKDAKIKSNLIFVFSGANGRYGNYDFYGLNKYVSTGLKPDRSFFVIIDIFSEKESIRFSGSYNKKTIPAEILNKFYKLKNGKQNIFYDKNEFIKSRFNIIPMNNFETYLLSKDFQAISFSNRNDDLSGIFYLSKNYSKELCDYFYEWLSFLDSKTFPVDKDYNYNHISLFGKEIIIPENLILVFILIIIFISIFIRLFLPNLQRLRLGLTLKTIPYLLFLFSLFFVFSFIPFLIFLPIDFLTGTKGIYYNFQILYFFNIFFVPQMIIFTLYDFLNKLPFPKHNYLYIFGSVMMSFINLVIFLILDISLVYIFLWVLIVITLSNFTGKNIFLKFILYILTPLPLIKILFDLSLGNADILRTSFNIPVLQHFIFCLATFPFLLLLMRIRLITRYKYRIFLSKFIYLFIMTGIIIFSIVFFIILSVKVFPEEPVIYATYKTENNKGSLSLKSDILIGRIKIKKGNNMENYNLKEYNEEFLLPVFDKPYKILLNKKKYGLNDFYSLKINSQLDVEYIKICLTVPYSYNPLESNYSYINITDISDKQTEEEIYEFKIPRNPGNDFDLDLFLIPIDKYKLSVEIDYPRFTGDSIEIIKNEGHILRFSKFTEEFNL